jgi:hypothetical protein
LLNQVVVRLVGGLGNQMFQYAAARSVSYRLGADLRLDLSWFGADPDRQFALSPFHVKAEIIPAEHSKPLRSGAIIRYGRRLLRLLCPNQGGIPVFMEHSFEFDPAIDQVVAPVLLEGYFQSEKYFNSIREHIAQDFSLHGAPSPRAEKILRDIRQCDAICVHIRRGDYVNNSAANAYHGVCSLDYYKSGLEEVIKGLESPHCFVFSDDMAWVRHNFETKIPTTLVDIHGVTEAHEDLRIMAACKRFVIANSSLSWWGAWLGSREGKIVVAPRQWFKGGKNSTTDLIPENWIQL